MDAAISRRLREGAQRLGVDLPAPVVTHLGTYLELLLTWNRRIRLTAVVDPEEVVDKHFLDALALLPHLPEPPGGATATLVDVGSGAGFPGAVIALARPSIAVTLVESVQKKAAFLGALKRELALANVEVYADRMEKLVGSGRRFTTAVSRATFAPARWIVEGRALTMPGGRLIAMVVPGPDPTVDLDRIAPTWRTRYAAARILPTHAPGRARALLDTPA